MTKELNEAAKHIADELIFLSKMLDKKMETWEDTMARNPNSSNKDVSAGFITKESNKPGVDLVIDIQAPPDSQKALLRTWGIESVVDSNGNERYNNIQLSFVVDYDIAREFVGRGQALTRDDIVHFLHTAENSIDRIIVSDQTGKDDKSQQLLGSRHDLDAKSLESLAEDTAKDLIQIMEIVLQRLKQSVVSEAKT